MKTKYLFVLIGLWMIGIHSNAASDFHVTQTSEVIPEAGVFTRYRVQHGRTACSFIPPALWGGSVREQQLAIVFKNPKGTGTLSLRFMSSHQVPVAQDGKLDWNVYLQGAFPGESILEQGECYASNTAGPLFLLRTAQRDVVRRVGFVKSGETLFAFELTAPLEGFEGAHLAWTALLNSFRIEKQEPKNGVIRRA